MLERADVALRSVAAGNYYQHAGWQACKVEVVLLLMGLVGKESPREQ